MKTLHFIAPAIAVVIAGGLVGAQRQKISKLETESAILQQHIAARQSEEVALHSNMEPSRPNKPVIEKHGIDWLEIAAVFGEMQNGGGIGDMRKMMSFQSKIQKMDRDELLAAIEEIKGLELGDEQRMALESMLISPLVVKDPEFLLKHFSDHFGDEDSGMSWQLGSALGAWAKKDQAAAIAWFDQAIADGKFESKSLDGKSQIRIQFEMSLISQLISTDTAAAQARVSALPADQRKDALSGYVFQSQKPSDQAAYANLVRANLSEEESYEVIGQQASMIAMMGNFEKVDTYLDSIGAKGEERIKAAENAAQGKITSGFYQTKLTEDKIDSMRKWLGTQAPDSVDRVTGESLGQLSMMGGSMKFAEASEMIMKYHTEGGSDDLLTGFLSGANYMVDKEQAKKIAEKISDPVKREEALENLE